MNTITAQHSCYDQILSRLSGEDAEAFGNRLSVQGLSFEAKSDDASGTIVVCFSEIDSDNSWVAIPLGWPAKGGKKAPDVLPDLVATSLKHWTQLPPNTLDAEEIHQQITQLGKSLSASRVVEFGAHGGEAHWFCWLVPLGGFRLIGSVIHDGGPPPATVIRDWEYQFRNKPSPSFFSIVSPTGWVVDLTEIIRSLRTSIGITASQGSKSIVDTLKIPVATVAWPFQGDRSATQTVAPLTEEQDSSALQSALNSLPPKPSKQRKSAKSKSRTQWWIGAAIATICVGFLAFGLTADQTDRTDRTDRTDQTDRTAQTVQTDRTAQTVQTAQTAQTESSDNIALEATEIAPDSEQEMELPTLDAIDGHSLANTLADVKPMVETMILPQPSGEASSEDLALPVDIAGEPTDDEVGMADNIEAAVDGLESADRLVQEHLDMDSWGTRREVRFGRGVNSKNGLCSATFKLDSDNIKDIVILQEEIQTIAGSGMCEWRIAKEDQEGELVVRVFSKPAPKWLWMIQVGARTHFGAEPVSIAPGEAVVIINRLRAHSNWLIESLDALQIGPQRPRVPGMPDLGSYSRWLRSQERETDRAIRQWTTIAELCDILTASGKIDLSFSVNSVDRENMNK